MPVLFDSSAFAADSWAARSGGHGTLTKNHVVNTLATDLVAIVGVVWMGTGITSGGTLSATFGGVSMTGATAMRWNSDAGSYYMVQLFTLPAPATGSQSVAVSAASMAGDGALALVSATYSGVESIGSIVVQTGSNTASNSVAVSSVSAAYRVVTVHFFGGLDFESSLLSNYNLTKRAATGVDDSIYRDGSVLLGDAPGAATVTGTAHQNESSSLWGAYGVPLSPSIVKGNASLNVSIATAGSGHLYRVGTPSPQRTWVIES